METPFELIRADGYRSGLVSLSTLQEWAAQGHIRADTPIYVHATAQYQAAGSIVGLTFPTSRSGIGRGILVMAATLVCMVIVTGIFPRTKPSRGLPPSFVPSQTAKPAAPNISREDLGEAWPLTVDGGTLWQDKDAVLFETDGKVYAVNPAAHESRRKYGWENIDNIRVDAPGYENDFDRSAIPRKNLDPLIARAPKDDATTPP